MRRATLAAAAALLAAAACYQAPPPPAVAPAPGERHLANIRQLTRGGENAEAYFSPDGRQLIFQSTRDGRRCDQQYVMNVDGSDVHRVSSGAGKTTCGYFFFAAEPHPSEYVKEALRLRRKIFFASTQAVDT